ncbi:T9SS type A sorting domain-containing protein [Flavobacterium sp. SM15]|uniref:T9SS type A sorting domain-containing protein n=1 Tax=Flavobacterium sp. SM15 TaxID=2908005 RepID=UPI001EDA4679|nr:T9SS type A sorting domain-containing protein [Flavobacterium sp. SM15]MCG2612189.1 T9SS type A sorting domain-containing protein [Flavobacterium sp. SM15]
MKKELRKVLKASGKSLSKVMLMTSLVIGLNSFGQNFQTQLIESWTNNNWQNMGKTTYAYDANNYMINYQYQIWDTPSSNWKNLVQYNHTNNPNGTLSSYISQNWDEANSVWLDANRAVYSYNPQGSITEIIVENNLGGNNWANASRTVQTYDANNYLVNYLFQLWNSSANSWENLFQYNYTNNPDGTINFYIDQNWDEQTTTWINSKRVTFNYDGANNIQSKVTEDWVGTDWKNSSKQINTYDGNNHLIHYLFQGWDEALSAWKSSSQYNMTNNANGYLEQQISQTWNENSSIWENQQRVTYTYQPTMGVNDLVFANGIAVYPNPASDMIRIQTKNFAENKAYAVFDQFGRPVVRGALNGEETTVNINHLAKGIYFIQVGQGKNQTLKVIKQ